MSDTVKVQGPVSVQSDGPARVAFELMQKIADAEYESGKDRGREYWITLYVQCYKATHGHVPSTILAIK